MGKGWKKGSYCTCFPDKLFGVYYGDHCFEHDLDYSNEHPNIASRKEADKKLKKSVYNEFKKQKKPLIGLILSNMMYFIVRLMGWTYWKKW